MAKSFRVYKSDTCTYCHQAMRFLEAFQAHHPVGVETVDVNRNPRAFQEVVRLTGRTTVPQIFLDDEYIGGWSELAAAAKNGKLDAFMRGEAWHPPQPWWRFWGKGR